MSIMLKMSCYTGFFNVRRKWQSLYTEPRFYLHLIRMTGWLWIYTPRTTDGRPFKQKKLSVPCLYPGVPEGFIIFENASNNKAYGEIRTLILKSNTGSGKFLPFQSTINYQNLEEVAYDDEEKCDLIKEYFSLTSKMGWSKFVPPRYRIEKKYI